MIDLIKGLPDTIEVEGNLYLIKTDYREWLKFGIEMKKQEMRDYSYLFINDMPEAETVEEISKVLKILVEFYNCPSVYPASVSEINTEETIDFENDQEFIYTAFLKQYRINLINEDLHWHEFMTLFRGLFVAYESITSIRTYSGDDFKQLKEKARWSIRGARRQDEETERLYNELK